QMKQTSSPRTKGIPARNATCRVYAAGPPVATRFEKKCSTRKAPIGTMPVSECKRRQKNECPCPARSGATPPLSCAGAAGLAVDPKGLYLSLPRSRQNFSLFCFAAMKSRRGGRPNLGNQKVLDNRTGTGRAKPRRLSLTFIAPPQQLSKRRAAVAVL